MVFVIAMVAPMAAGLFFLPILQHASGAGVLLIAIALFYSFYYTARGGSPVMGTFLTISLTLVVTIGSVSSEVMVFLVKTIGLCAFTGVAFVGIAHTLLPDLPPDPALAGPKQAAPPRPNPSVAGRNALRAMLVVLPMALVFLFISGSPSYTVVMIKVATMGQQASSDKSREMGRSLLESTVWGGIGAVIAYNILLIWPSLVLYVLLIALAALIYGRFIFQGTAIHPRSKMVSYAFLTMLIILAPAMLDNGSAAGASAAFWSRMFLFVLIAVYGTLAVHVFDAFWPGKKQSIEPDHAAAASSVK